MMTQLYQQARGYFLVLGFVTVGVAVLSILMAITGQWVFNQVVLQNNISLLLAGVSILAVLMLALICSQYLAQQAEYRLARKIYEQAATLFFKQLLDLPAHYISHVALPKQLAKLKDFDNAYHTYFQPFFAKIFGLPLLLFYLWGMWMLVGSLVSLSLFAGLGLTLAAYLTHKKRDVLMRACELSEAQLQTFIQESQQKKHHIHALQGTAIWQQRFLALNEMLTERQKQLKAFALFQRGVAYTILWGSAGLLFVLGLNQVQSGVLSLGACLAGICLHYDGLSRCRAIVNVIARSSKIKQRLSQIQAVMDIVPEQASKHTTQTSVSLDAEIVFSDVSFHYKKGHKAALKNLSFKIPAKQFVVITGQAAAGKSTVFNLLLKLYLPDTGCITFGGQDYSEYHTQALRRAIAYVPSRIHLFAGTFAENLAAMLSDAEYKNLDYGMRCAGLDNILMAYPDGLETRIQDEWDPLCSPSLLQGIALTQAYCKSSSLYLFDEPDIYFDIAQQAQFISTLNQLKQRATVILITQTPIYMQHADQILVLDDGCLVDGETKADLLSQLMAMKEQQE